MGKFGFIMTGWISGIIFSIITITIFPGSILAVPITALVMGIILSIVSIIVPYKEKDLT